MSQKLLRVICSRKRARGLLTLFQRAESCLHTPLCPLSPCGFKNNGRSVLCLREPKVGHGGRAGWMP